ncbi:MAG: hypothetical protein IJR49_00830 [Treponema sp.]|nr:hypothetical protein [Treponema sp.]
MEQGQIVSQPLQVSLFAPSACFASGGLKPFDFAQGRPFVSGLGFIRAAKFVIRIINHLIAILVLLIKI